MSGERVELQPITPVRARAMISGVPDPDLPWEDGFPMDPLREALEMILAADVNGEVLGPFFAYVVVRKADGMVIGDIGFHGGPDEDGEVEIGYALVPKARGLGLASDAVSTLLAWASAQPEVKQIIALVKPGNPKSERLLSRMNFRPEGEAGGARRFVFAGHPVLG